MGRQGRLDQRSVGKPQPPGMKMQLSGDAAPGMRACMCTSTAIFAVTDNRMPLMRHMNAKLVRAAGARLQGDQRHADARRLDQTQ